MNLNKPSGVILLLVWSLFMGVTAISIGFGAAFPALNAISQPVVCSNGHLQLLTSTSHPQPGVTYTAEKWQCVDNQSGKVSAVNEWSMFLFNGLIYGAILFVIIMISYRLVMKRRARLVAARATVDETNLYTSVDLPPGAYVTSVDKYELQELTRQYKAGQFSEKEYQRKRQAILAGVANRADAAPATPHAQLESFKNNELQDLKRRYAEGQVSDVEYWQKLGQTAGHTAHPATAPATPSSTTAQGTHDLENKLAELKKLRDENLITEQDYQQKKLELLSRI